MTRKLADLVEEVRERRKHVKTVFLPEHILHDILEVPEGAVIERIDYDFMRRALVLIVSHPDFEEVAPYCEPPALHGIVRARAQEEFDVGNETHVHRHFEVDWEL